MELFSVFGRILLKDDGVEEKLKNINDKAEETDSRLSKLGESMTKIGEGLSKFGQSLITHVTLPLAAAGVGIVKLADKASDLNEAQNVIENTFKKSAKAIEAWTNTTANSAGISKTASSQWVGFMGALLKSSGVTEKASGDMSKNLVQLTGDMSSFYNISTSDMWEKIRAGMSGETMPLKQLGINMNVANLEAYALAEGIKKPYKEMSQAEQTILRYNYLLSVTKDAQGDFGRTLSTSFANQARVAKLNLETIATTLGSKFLPSVMQGTKGLNDYLVALNGALNGENQSSKLGGAINNIANAISKLTPEKIKNIATIGGALASIGPGLLIFGKLTTTTGNFEKGIGKTVESIGKFSSKAVDGFSNFGSSASGVFSKLGDLAVFKKLGSGIDTIRLKGMYAMDGIKGKLAPFAANIGGIFSKLGNSLPTGLKSVFSKAIGVIGPQAQILISAFSGLGGKIVSGLKSIVSIGLKMFAPAALIGVLLLGLGVVEEKMGGQLDKIIANITQKGPQLIQKFTAGLLAKIPELIKTGTTLLMNLINAITANAPALLNAAVAIITSLVNGLVNNIPRLIPVILQLIQTILIAIVDNLPKIIMAGLNLLVALAQGIANNIDKIVETIVKVVEEIIKVLIQNMPLVIEAGIKILVALIEGISKAIPQLIAALPEIVKAIWNGLKEVDWGSLGAAILNGILEGLKAAAKGIWGVVKAVGNDIKEGFKAFFGIHSPSTVMRDEVGKNISLGIAQGIKDVDFMQTISDILNDGSSDAKTAAKKVTNAVNEEISKINDNTKKAVNDLNKQLTQLSEQETVALRGVKGSGRYAIEDEYNQKKKAIKDEIQLRKDQADKEIAQIKRIGSESKDELQKELDDRKSFIENINNLNDQIKEALKNKYTDEEKIAEDSINKELDAWENWKTQSEDAINSVFDAKEKRLEDDQKAVEDALQAESDALEDWKTKAEQNIEDVSSAKIAALKAQEDALDAQTDADDRASTHAGYENKISDLQSQIKYEHNDYNKAELQKQLISEQTEYQKELAKEAIDDKKAALQAQENAIQADADKQKKNIQNIYTIKKADLEKRTKDIKAYYENQKTLMEQDKKAQLDNINQIYNANKTSLNNQLEDVKNFYTQKLSDANLEAESEKLIMDNNQKDIVALLNSYGEQYKQAGQTLGDRLAEGFKPAIDNIKSMIASITDQISAARDSALSTMQTANAAVGNSNIPYSSSSTKNVSNNDNSKTSVTNNFNFTHNSPLKATPSEEHKQDESFFRKAIFQIA